MWGDWHTDNPNTPTQAQKNKLINQAKLIAGITAAYAGEDVNVAAGVAAEAVRWNSSYPNYGSMSKNQQAECRQLGISTSDCGKYHGKKNLETLRQIGLFIIPTTPEEIAIAVVTGGAGRYAIKAGGKILSKTFEGKEAAKKVLDKARESKKIDNNFYRDGSQFESNIINGKPIANLRLEYVDEVQSISNHTQGMLKQGKSEEEVAVWAINKRNELKVKYRGDTPPEKLREIELRNIEKYGNALGPTAHYLRQKGKTWKEIIDSASKADGSDLDFAPKGFNR
ncbi:VENN motif pre-toxin domain-containing protein [Moraxella catarrhalis]|uniref:Hemolysin n=2 Tax=Moraxella catarrhalis TaxID=480 RepID=A0AB36DQM8_MORCA|nr:VENN motif pre-toxin domain-containing protein [Moraxella catarrhalis]MPX29061.1 hypothetical protein [Moraxella catarrhalis]OAV27164.1 Hemolysin [Moraxella catarrhalis]